MPAGGQQQQEPQALQRLRRHHARSKLEHDFLKALVDVRSGKDNGPGRGLIEAIRDIGGNLHMARSKRRKIEEQLREILGRRGR